MNGRSSEQRRGADGDADRGSAMPAGRREPDRDGPEEELQRQRGPERRAGDEPPVAVAPGQRDEQGERERHVRGLVRVDDGGPEQRHAVDAPVAHLERPERADERRERDRRGDPVGGRGGSAVSGTAGSTAAIGQIALVVSVIARSGRRIRVVAVHDRLRLRVDLLVEVESEPVLARERGESPRTSAASGTAAKRDELERASGVATVIGRVRAACGAWLASEGDREDEGEHEQQPRGRRRGLPIPMPAPSSPHVASGTNQTRESLGRAIASGSAASA